MTNIHTFVFADLAGFTALAELHGDEQAADIAVEFCRSINRLLPNDAEDLKMLGDACLLRFGSAADAVLVSLRLTSEIGPRHGFPEVRIGMNTGGAVLRGSEWFGTTINVAARVAELAGPGQILLTAATREEAGMQNAFVFDDHGVHELRHVGTPVHLFRARRAEEDREASWPVDLVCR